MRSSNSQGAPRLVKTSDAAARIGISVRTLKRYVHDGRVTPTVTLPSGHLRWSEEDIERLRGVSA